MISPTAARKPEAASETVSSANERNLFGSAALRAKEQEVESWANRYHDLLERFELLAKQHAELRQQLAQSTGMTHGKKTDVDTI
jgi:hypothetical protein